MHPTGFACIVFLFDGVLARFVSQSEGSTEIWPFNVFLFWKAFLIALKCRRFMELWLWDAARTRKSPSWLYETETALTMVIPFCRLGRWSCEQPLVDLCI